MPLEKLTRWSGPAAVLGGALWISAWFGGADDIRVLFSFVGPALLLTSLGLAGLYRQLPAHEGKPLFLGMALAGQLLFGAGALAIAIGDADWGWLLAMIGFLPMIIGSLGVGVLTLSARTLGWWRFSPIALGACYVGIAFTGSDAGPDRLQMIVGILVGVCWLLLGFGLWGGRDDTAGPAKVA